MTKNVMDASAVLAFLQDEPGRDFVEPLIAGALISSVNLSEVVAKIASRGTPAAVIEESIRHSGLAIVPVDARLGLDAGLMFPRFRPFGLSLGDRVCLALAIRENLPVVTADRVWATLGLPITVTLIR